jgi:hypothetical protein
MKQFVLLLAVLLTAWAASSQAKTDTIVMDGNTLIVTTLPNPADSLRRVGDINAALKAYADGVIADPGFSGAIYNYACLLSIDNKLDSCFRYLNVWLKLDTAISALSDPDFIHARNDIRWAGFEDRLISNVEKKSGFAYKDLPYAKALWRMQALDQAYYEEISMAKKSIGKHSTVDVALWDLKERLNKQNQQELEALIAAKGWPKNSVVGGRAASAAFLIIQHSDAEKQKKYLPTIEALCKQNEAGWESYALMYDRILMSENKPQRYGSQVKYDNVTGKYTLYQLEDEQKVDVWRKELGMESLSDYLAYFDMKYEPKRKTLKLK